MNVGLPVPANRRLIAVLQNPLLFSLYADIVTPDDMPLAESGEVTAFRVVDEFWERRVVGLSRGLRAVGDSESSQEAKAFAVAYLADRSLAGDFKISLDATSQSVSAGVQMLVREGVLRPQGTTSVVWIHDWIREFAIVNRLLDGIESDTAINLARAVAGCQNDSAARSAATGGVKRVLSRRADGAVQYLSELWILNKGLAREALAVVIEGPASGIVLAELPEEMLLEAVTLAVELGALQWEDQVASLPSEPFFGGVGDELHARVVRLEIDLLPEGAVPQPQVILRLVSRDRLRLDSGRGSTRGTIHSLLGAVARAKLFHDNSVVDWLVHLGSIAPGFELAELAKTVKGMIDQGEASRANRVFQSILGFASAERAKEDYKAARDWTRTVYQGGRRSAGAAALVEWTRGNLGGNITRTLRPDRS